MVILCTYCSLVQSEIGYGIFTHGSTLKSKLCIKDYVLHNTRICLARCRYPYTLRHLYTNPHTVVALLIYCLF